MGSDGCNCLIEGNCVSSHQQTLSGFQFPKPHSRKWCPKTSLIIVPDIGAQPLPSGYLLIVVFHCGNNCWEKYLNLWSSQMELPDLQFCVVLNVMPLVSLPPSFLANFITLKRWCSITHFSQPALCACVVKWSIFPKTRVGIVRHKSLSLRRSLFSFNLFSLSKMSEFQLFMWLPTLRVI